MAGSEPLRQQVHDQESGGFCLGNNVYGGYGPTGQSSLGMTSSADCGNDMQVTDVYWHYGSGTSRGSTIVNNGTGQCLTYTADDISGDYPSLAACDSGDPHQLWHRA